MSYYDWLTQLLVPDDDLRNAYQKVLLGLYNSEYYYTVKNDDNRAEDGEQLRVMYENDTGLWCNNYSACSVLEMLGGLALRCENEIMYDPDEGCRTHIWFWDMIKNMGLEGMDDWHFDYDEFEKIVARLNDRTYGKDGYGGPFYIYGFHGDMRKIELWYQLNQYVMSKYAW